MANCEACEDLKEYAPNFTYNGITDTECESLQNNTGLNPDLTTLHKNCEDLNDMLDCLIGNHRDKLVAYDICDLKDYIDELMRNLYNLYKALICSDCGQWAEIEKLWKEIEKLWKEIEKLWTEIEKIWKELESLKDRVDALEKELADLKDRVDDLEKQLADLKALVADLSDLVNTLNTRVTNLGNRVTDVEQRLNNMSFLESLVDADGYMTVTKVYTYTVPVDKFISTANTNNIVYWSGAPAVGESFISIPVAQMDIVDTVVAQPQVVGDRVHAVTVAIQNATRSGNYFNVNFDTYEIEGHPGDSGYPFAVPIKFVVVGRKKVA